MAVIGSFIKNAINLSNSLVDNSVDANHQEKQLKNLVSSAKDTAFGQYYGFQKILERKDMLKAFQEQVPIFTYQSIQKWWSQQQQYADITWPGRPEFFALSSGTTGKKSKRIPVTDAMLKSFQSVSLAQINALHHFDLPAEFFEKEFLALGSSTNLKERKGHLEGEISGINAFNTPFWFDRFYKPGKKIAQIDDWDDRLEAIVEAAENWDIGAIAGIPSWVLMMLKAIKKHYQLDTIHDLWPDLRIYASGGVAFEPYRDNFESLFGKPMIYMDTYLASEGFFAFNARPDTNAMQLALNHGVFYEFIPFDEDGFSETGELLDNPKVLTFEQLEENKEYALIVSTPAGAWRYMIGDTIKFTDLNKAELLITGRTKYFLNVVGAQLSEEKLNTAIQQLSEEMDVMINEFSVGALKNESDEYYHQWIISANSQKNEEQAAEKLDVILKDLNKNYRVARDKALKDISVKLIPEDQFYNWLEDNKKKGGQIKVPKIMKADKMQELLSFIDQQN